LLAGLATLVLAWVLGEILSRSALAQTLVSPGLWNELVRLCGGQVRYRGGQSVAEVPWGPLLGSAGGWVLATWLIGSVALALRTRRGLGHALAEFGRWGTVWWLLPGLFALVNIALEMLWPGGDGTPLLYGTLPFWLTAAVAGWGSTWVALSSPLSSPSAGAAGPAVDASMGEPHAAFPTAARSGPAGIPWAVWLGMAVYTVVFTGLNWQLYQALRLPHGDSAMYEEHLWNLLHGKGFRSYLDNGRLFLGEHVQVVHLLLVPVYLLWPSHLLLELVQSAALAAGAIPVFRITRRATGNSTAATLLALAYLLAFPVQFLDIAIDFKTFRPNSFEIPCLLLALDALESRRFRACAVWVLLTLSCQEDVAPVLAPLGLWIALRWPAGAVPAEPNTKPITEPITDRRVRLGGLGLMLGATAWLVLVVKVILPWFRGGADVHFAQYFSDLGDSTDSIVTTVLKHPDAVWRRWWRPESALFAIGLLAPVGWLPLLSPGRLLVAVPLWGVLCLSDITDSPLHHFHAPLVPILFWSAAHGLANAGRVTSPLARRWLALHPSMPSASMSHAVRWCLIPTAAWAVLSAWASGFWIGVSPQSLAFWDRHSSGYWRELYVQGERSRRFAQVLAQIPPTARVASTDLVHPRFTHHARSYDYSSYRPIVPDDCEYIVIDVRAPGSQIRGPDDVPELRQSPTPWRLLPDQTEGYFLVLKRE
jgi:uncharacterized membrane protein